MQFVNQFEVPASLEDAWQHLGDVPRIAPCLPGATVRQLTDDTYEGEVTIKVGPIRTGYTGQATVTRRDDSAHVMVLDAQGQEGRGKGSAAATITLELVASSPLTTLAQVTTDLTITGRLAQFGRSAMADVSQRLMSQFADNLAAQIEPSGRTPAAAGAPAPAGEPAPAASTTRPTAAAGVATAAASELDAMTFLAPLLRRAAPAAGAAAVSLCLGLVLGSRRARQVPATDRPWPGCRH